MFIVRQEPHLSLRLALVRIAFREPIPSHIPSHTLVASALLGPTRCRVLPPAHQARVLPSPHRPAFQDGTPYLDLQTAISATLGLFQIQDQRFAGRVQLEQQQQQNHRNVPTVWLELMREKNSDLVFLARQELIH